MAFDKFTLRSFKANQDKGKSKSKTRETMHESHAAQDLGRRLLSGTENRWSSDRSQTDQETTIQKSGSDLSPLPKHEEMPIIETQKNLDNILQDNAYKFIDKYAALKYFHDELYNFMYIYYTSHKTLAEINGIISELARNKDQLDDDRITTEGSSRQADISPNQLQKRLKTFQKQMETFQKQIREALEKIGRLNQDEQFPKNPFEKLGQDAVNELKQILGTVEMIAPMRALGPDDEARIGIMRTYSKEAEKFLTILTDPTIQSLADLQGNFGQLLPQIGQCLDQIKTSLGNLDLKVSDNSPLEGIHPLDYIEKSFTDKAIKHYKKILRNELKREPTNEEIREFLDEIDAKITKLVENKTIVINVRKRHIPNILKEGFKSQRETSTTRGILQSRKRAIQEQGFYNLDQDCDPAKTPIYGCLIDKLYNHRPGRRYGSAVVVIKKSVKDRTTFTCDDSMKHVGIEPPNQLTTTILPTPLTKPNRNAFPLIKLDALDNAIANKQNPLKYKSIRDIRPYVEVQIHRHKEPLAKEHIEEIIFWTKPDSKLTALLDHDQIRYRTVPFTKRLLGTTRISTPMWKDTLKGAVTLVPKVLKFKFYDGPTAYIRQKRRESIW